jgi:hypothetical protein
VGFRQWIEHVGLIYSVLHWTNGKVSFGPSIRNQHRMEVTPYITSPDTCLSPLVFVPSDDAEILCFELYTGQLVQRLQGTSPNVNGRVTCVAGRTSHQVKSLLEYSNTRNYTQEPLMQKLAYGNQVCFTDRRRNCT